MPADRAAARLAGVAGAVSLAWVLSLAASAHAQLAAAGAITTDYRYRGISLSGGRPALSLDLSWDVTGGRADGAYVGASLIGGPGAGDAGPRLSHLEYLGYARRLGGDWAWDVGLSHADFTRYVGAGAADNGEVYAGLRRAAVSAYLHYSPDYFGSRERTLYSELEASLHAAAHWRLFAHVGALTPLGGAALFPFRERYDASAGIAALLSRGELRLSVTTAGPAVYSGEGAPSRSALVLAASCFF